MVAVRRWQEPSPAATWHATDVDDFHAAVWQLIRLVNTVGATSLMTSSNDMPKIVELIPAVMATLALSTKLTTGAAAVSPIGGQSRTRNKTGVSPLLTVVAED